MHIDGDSNCRMNTCIECKLKDSQMLELREMLVEKTRKVNSLEVELLDIKTAIRVLLRSVDRYA